LVLLCTYNERQNIEALLPEIWTYAPQAQILIVDDNSPDGTGQLADELAATNPLVRVLHRPAKQGLGTATIAGLRAACREECDLVINLDADFSHNPRFIPALLAAAEQADVAIGSRYVVGGGVVNWGLRRHLMSRAINAYTRWLLRIPVRDCSGAFRCFRAARLRQLDFDRFIARGYAVQEELLFRLKKLGCRFAETPIVFEDRRFGQSKINLREGLVALWVILRLALGLG